MRRRLLQNLSHTFLSQFFSAFFLLLVLRFAATTLSEDNFGLFIIMRRVVAIAFPILSLKLGISLSKFGYFDSSKFLFKSIGILIFNHICLLLIILFFPNQFSIMIFGEAKYAELLLILVIYIFSYSLHSLVHGYYRGIIQIGRMNMLVILFNMVALLAVVLFKTINALQNYFLVVALINIVICLIYLWNPFKLLIENENNEKNILFKTFISYGIIRLPSGFFFSGLLFAPIFVATQWISLEVAGHIGIIISIVSLVQIVSMPVGTLFLPLFSHLQNGNDTSELRDKVQVIIDFVFSVPHFIGLFFVLFGREVILICFGVSYLHILPEVQILSISLGFFVTFVIIRSILDGVSHKPYVNTITIISLIVFLVGTIIFGDQGISIYRIATLLMVSITLLGLLSVIYLSKHYAINVISTQNCFSLAWLSLLYIFSFWLSNELLEVPIIKTIICKIIFTAFAVFLSFSFYKYLKYSWIHYLPTFNKNNDI